MISVLILTFNEEINIARCVESVRWSDDVVVFDSMSTDRTREIAEAAGARVFQRKFDNFGSQREAARTTVPFKHDWILALDADEKPDELLVEELKRISGQQDAKEGAWRMRRKDHFFGRWLKRSTLYPTWFVRFVRRDRVKWEERAVHESPIVEGAIGTLKGHLIHDNLSKGLEDWKAKHQRYAQLEAGENIKAMGRTLDWGGVFALSDPVRRRRALKELSFRLPFRPTLRFVFMYFWRLGILDGRAGFRYCRLISDYERQIVVETRRLKALKAGAGPGNGSAGPG